MWSACLLSNSDSLTENDKPFSCFRCGLCCTRYQVLLNPEEAQRIADYLKISVETFRAKYTDPRWPDFDNFLLCHRDGSCVFLRSESNKHFSCSIHTIRPQACRNWESSLSRRDCRDGLADYWQLTISPCGELQGTEENLRLFHAFLQTL
jgi:uncharacterized protein